MAGIYVHIPFCRRACHYCNFHFSTSLRFKDDVLNAIEREMAMRRGYIDDNVSTIYFGGGTPSLLSVVELNRLLSRIHALYDVDDAVEITLEANPDDLSPQYIRNLKAAGVNRLSIGIQSFHDDDLQWMNRVHDARQARQCLDHCRAGGIENYSIDLIFGGPTTTDVIWQKNLEYAIERQVPHISAYLLTVEPKTALGVRIAKQMEKPLDDDRAAVQFDISMDTLEDAGYLHYEISNYCKPGHTSRHNSSYWEDVRYIGFGPSAHSYDRQSRQWNVAHNIKYINAISSGELFFEVEQLTSREKYNELLLTCLRTSRGVDIRKVRALGGPYGDYFLACAKTPIGAGEIIEDVPYYRLSRHVRKTANAIIADLFYIN